MFIAGLVVVAVAAVVGGSVPLAAATRPGAAARQRAVLPDRSALLP